MEHWGRRGRDCMVVGFTTTYETSALSRSVFAQCNSKSIFYNKLNDVLIALQL
jgi:hypothetical protein